MTTANQLQAGGVYASKRDDCFRVSKIIVLDEFAAFVLSYRDNFSVLPEPIATKDLQPFYFAPIDPAGFAKDLVFLHREDVTESEMQTYRDHIEFQSEGYQ